MNDELKKFLEKHGIDPAVLLTAIVDFMKNAKCFNSELNDIDSMLTYLRKESIEEFAKLLVPSSLKSEDVEID